MTTPALRAAALAMARLYSDDGRAERRAEHLEEHARVAVVAYLRARAEQPHLRSNQYAVGLLNMMIAELDPPAGPIGEDQDD